TSPKRKRGKFVLARASGWCVAPFSCTASARLHTRPRIVRSETALVRQPIIRVRNQKARRMSCRRQLRFADALVHPLFSVLITGDCLIGRTRRIIAGKGI